MASSKISARYPNGGHIIAQYIHSVPGRLRIKTLALKRNESQARQVKDHLDEMQGILGTDISILTGSIVIKYNACLINSNAILTSLHEQGYIHITNGAASQATQWIHSSRVRPVGVHPAQKVADAFIAKLIETALERSATALVAALI